MILIELMGVHLHVERHDWTLYLVFVSVVALECFGWFWHVLAIVSLFPWAEEVVESLDQKAQSLFKDLMECLVA